MDPILNNLLTKYPRLSVCKEEIEKAAEILIACYERGGKVLTCGNGGSASDSEHIVGELMKGFISKRELPVGEKKKFTKILGEEDGEYISSRLQGTLPAISLTSNVSLNTAVANDVAHDMIFAQQVYGYGNAGDVVLCLSTSGNSTNIIRAIQVAAASGLSTIGFTGKSGGKMKDLCDVTIRVPEDETAAAQELHLPVYHALCMLLEKKFFPPLHHKQ